MWPKWIFRSRFFIPGQAPGVEKGANVQALHLRQVYTQKNRNVYHLADKDPYNFYLFGL